VAGFREGNPMTDCLVPRGSIARKAPGVYSLAVRRTQWRGHVSDPKSEASRNWVPVVPRLKEELEAYRSATAKQDDTELFPVSGRGGSAPNREPMDPDHMGRRTVASACRAQKIVWKGWHAFRRGLGTTLYELGCDPLVVQRILRHSHVSTTARHYVRVRDPRVEDAMARLSAETNKRDAGKTRG